MTAVTAIPDMRSGRLRGLAWVTWRQHRVALGAATAVFAGLAVFLLLYGHAMHSEYARLGLASCPLTSDACQAPLDIFEQRYQTVAMYLPRFVEFLPAVLGVFIGAPLVARELESGTYRFTWTQGRNRTQWVATKMALIGTYLVVISLAFSALCSWWFQPWNSIMGRMSTGQAYELIGVVFAARTLFAFVLGVLLGALIRRTVPAMLATAAGWLAVVWPSVIFLRPLIQKPVSAPVSTNAVTENGWTISNWYQDAAGHHLGSATLERLLLQTRLTGRSWTAFLAGRGYTQWTSYQPDSRFWHFQTVEAVFYTLLATGLALVAARWVTRRAN